MKILRLTGTTPTPWGVDLHPRMTIVHGLAPEVAGPVRAAIDALVRARLTPPELAASGLGGIVLVDDREVAIAELTGLVPTAPLRGADLLDGVLALTAGRRRALDAEVAAAAGELSRAQADLAAQQTASGPVASDLSGRWRARADAAAALRMARRRVADAVDASARADVARAEAALPPTMPSAELDRIATERVTSARLAHEAAVAAHTDAEAEADRLARASTAGVDALRAELTDLESQCVLMAPASVPSDSDRRALADRHAFLQSELAASASSGSTEQVARALAAAEGHRGVAVVEAARVAVEWERVRDLVAEAEAAPPPPPPMASPVEMSEVNQARLARANEDVVSARRAVAEASGASPLDPNDVEALEAAHAEVLSAWEGSERRIGVGKARRRLEDAQLAEREILARMGFASYTEFMVSGRASGSPSQLNAEEARRALRDAEGRLATVEASVEREMQDARSAALPTAPGAWDADAAQGRLSATLAALRARAVDLLGEDPGEDVAGALRDRISTDPLPDLRLALDEVGVPLGEVLSREAVLARARDWVARSQSDGARQADLRVAIAEVEAHMTALDAAEGARVSWEAMVARRDALRIEVDTAVVAGAEVQEAEERVVRARADVHRAVHAVGEAEADAGRVADRARALTARGPAPTVAPVELTALEGAALDAQTALDVAVAHLLPRYSDAQLDAADGALGRAEARVVLAQLELDALRSIQETEAPVPTGAPDVDALTWRVLAVLASHRAAAVDGGPGPAPLVLDEPFGDLSPADAAVVCDALVGPSSAVQVIVVTERDDVATWSRGADPDGVGLAIDLTSVLQ